MKQTNERQRKTLNKKGNLLIVGGIFQESTHLKK